MYLIQPGYKFFIIIIMIMMIIHRVSSNTKSHKCMKN